MWYLQLYGTAIIYNSNGATIMTVKQCNLTNQVKKTKQKEEKHKNTNKIKDVGIMKNNYNTSIQ